jgi:myo-inositol-1(or 4)-monophosphatase
MTSMNPYAMLAGALEAADEAGKLLMGFLGRLENVEYKGSVNLVTEADRASERLLVDLLGRLLPEASILAEEGSGVERASELRWVVDPLDGTTNFAHGYPIFCISIALEQAGESAIGVVHDPTRNDFFAAVKGEGARLNGEPIAVSKARSLQDALLVTGFPYDVRTNPRNNVPQFNRFLGEARAVRRDGSAALNLAYLAAGRFDGFWEEGLSPWDVAAGALLVEEAGGRTSGYRGEPNDIHAGQIVATNDHVHDAMLEVLTRVEDEAGLPPLGTHTS